MFCFFFHSTYHWAVIGGKRYFCFLCLLLSAFGTLTIDYWWERKQQCFFMFLNKSIKFCYNCLFSRSSQNLLALLVVERGERCRLCAGDIHHAVCSATQLDGTLDLSWLTHYYYFVCENFTFSCSCSCECLSSLLLLFFFHYCFL